MYLLDVNAMIVQGKLRVVWSYNQNIHRTERIQALVDYLIAQLKVLCHEMQEKKGLAVSDFPLATLTEERLERLLDTHGTFEQVFDLSPYCLA
jgi:non-ribosomal peptide synthase protein (TIGR01720 family)